MYTEMTVKIKALALAVLVNGMLFSAAAYMFDGQPHQNTHYTASTVAATHNSANFALASFRP